MSTSALFTNFTDKEFVGYWDGKPKKFAPGASLYMPDYLARHFAKHLTNRELLRTDASGSLVYKNGDKFTSPKKPDEVPVFMELFNKAYIPDNTEELGNQTDNIESLIESANKNRPSVSSITNTPAKQDSTKPQIITPPDFDDDAESFEGKPKE